MFEASSAYCSGVSWWPSSDSKSGENQLTLAVRGAKPHHRGDAGADVSNRGPSPNLSWLRWRLWKRQDGCVRSHSPFAADCFRHAGQLHSWQLCASAAHPCYGNNQSGHLISRECQLRKPTVCTLQCSAHRKGLNWGSLFLFSDEVFDSPFLSSLSLVYPNFWSHNFRLHISTHFILSLMIFFSGAFFAKQHLACTSDQGTPKIPSPLQICLSDWVGCFFHTIHCIILPRPLFVSLPGWLWRQSYHQSCIWLRSAWRNRFDSQKYLT